MPSGPRSTATPANLSMPLLANRPERASWSAARIWTAKWPACRNASMLDEVLARLHSTMGGFSDTELKLLAVRPTSLSPKRVVTMVTPVAKAPSALRKALGSNCVAADSTAGTGALPGWCCGVARRGLSAWSGRQAGSPAAVGGGGARQAEVLAQRLARVVLWVQAAALQLGHDQADEVFISSRHVGGRQNEAVAGAAGEPLL